MRRKPTCVKCECDLNPQPDEVYCVETRGEERRPFRIWHADKWKCPKCGVEFISGYGFMPLAVEDEAGDSEVVEYLEKLYEQNEKVVFTHERWDAD